MKKALNAYELEDYHEAVGHFKNVVAVEPDNIEAHYKLGMSYVYSYRHDEGKEAISSFKEVLRLRDQGKDLSNKYWNTKFYLARSLQSDLQFDEAKEVYQEFLREVRNMNDLELISEIETRIKQCDHGKRLFENPIRVEIENLGTIINSSYPDYAPVISSDESIMIFTSRRDNTTGGKVDDADGHYYEDLYESRFVGGTWTAPRNLKSINTKYHEASIALSPDGQRLFVYKDKHKGNFGEILVSIWDDEDQEWGKLENIGENINGKFTQERSITITPDNKTIYFSTDRPGGFGGFDIWMSKWDYKEKKWAYPINLGPVVNTPLDEDAPFIHPDGTLYFSSNGHEVSLGEHDIYFTSQYEGQWEKPINLGYPINTAEDELFFVLSGSKVNAYYASEKEGGQGEKDIYKIKMPSKENISTAKNKKLATIALAKVKMKKLDVRSVDEQSLIKNITILRGAVTEEESNRPLAAMIYLVDNTINETVDSVVTNDLTGNYIVSLPAGKNYALVIDKDKYLFHSENFDLLEAEGYSEDTLDVQLKKIDIGKAIILNNIFYDYGKATLRSESTGELDRIFDLMNQNPSIKVEIGGHTDSDGGDDFNQKLSENRAQSVVDYLIGKGIGQERLVAKGYGESEPIASNETEKGRQQNRRTEFKIIEN